MQKSQKKEKLRNEILLAASIYSKELAGKAFLYVYGEECFEVLFKTDRFVHLTGVASNLSAQDFYDKAKSGILTTNQFYFSERHPFANAKSKLPCLQQLPMLTTSLVCVVKDMTTVTLTYKLGVTNLKFTLGLTEYTSETGLVYLPRTLRVRDKAIENSGDAEFVDFIFVRDGAAERYSHVAFASERKDVPEMVYQKLNEELRQQFTFTVPV